MRARLLLVLSLALVAVAVATGRAEASDPPSSTIDAAQPSAAWSGGPLLFTTLGTGCSFMGPTCDEHLLTVGSLDAANDVVISAQAGTATDVITLDVYSPDGTVVADSGSELSATPSAVLRDVAPGTYSVRVEALLGTGPVTYDATANAVDAGVEPAPEQPCNGEDAGLGPPPQEVVEAALDDDGRRVQLDVLVLLDGVDPAYASRFFEVVARPYAELAIEVVPTFEAVPKGTFEGVNSTDLIGQTQDLFPDRRVPAEYDIVELLTERDIEALGQTAVAGQAKCIGGIAFDEHAFEVSEAQETSDPAGIAIGPLTLIPEQAAKITAHEMGHLLGGQHHLANCVEGALPGGVLDDDSSPCSLMFNSADFIALRFSSINGPIVRGYTLLHATANDEPAEPAEPASRDAGGPPQPAPVVGSIWGR